MNYFPLDLRRDLREPTYQTRSGLSTQVSLSHQQDNMFVLCVSNCIGQTTGQRQAYHSIMSMYELPYRTSGMLREYTFLIVGAWVNYHTFVVFISFRKKANNQQPAPPRTQNEKVTKIIARAPAGKHSKTILVPSFESFCWTSLTFSVLNMS